MWVSLNAVFRLDPRCPRCRTRPAGRGSSGSGCRCSRRSTRAATSTRSSGWAGCPARGWFMPIRQAPSADEARPVPRGQRGSAVTRTSTEYGWLSHGCASARRCTTPAWLGRAGPSYPAGVEDDPPPARRGARRRGRAPGSSPLKFDDDGDDRRVAGAVTRAEAQVRERVAGCVVGVEPPNPARVGVELPQRRVVAGRSG